MNFLLQNISRNPQNASIIWCRTFSHFQLVSTDFNEKLFRFSFVPFYVISIFTRNAKNEAKFSLVFSYYPNFSRHEADSSRLRTTKISHLKNSLEIVAEDLFPLLGNGIWFMGNLLQTELRNRFETFKWIFCWISRTLFSLKGIEKLFHSFSREVMKILLDFPWGKGFRGCELCELTEDIR